MMEARLKHNRQGFVRTLLRVAKRIPLSLILFLFLVQPLVAATNPPPVQVFYVPVPEDQVFATFSGIYPGGASDKCDSVAPDVGSPINTYISLSIINTGTIIYYDQWEDDFEIDISNPTQATTQIWGDGDPATGVAPGYPTDLLTAGNVLILDNPVPVPRNAAQLLFDGGDKLGASRPIAMTRATWSGTYPAAPGTLLADAVEVYDAGRWGTRFQVPVGPTTTATQLFEYTALAVMAAEDDTTVTIDVDADGSAESTPVLAEGESYLIPGVQVGTVIEASGPLQVALITGDICDTYESRWYVLFPVDQWDDSYYSPVGTPAGGMGTTIWIFNPGDTPLSVQWESVNGAEPPLTVPPMGNASALVPDNSGAHFYAAEGSRFAALAAVGSDLSAGFNSLADWGFTLVPETQLTYQTLIGWGAGRDPLSTNNRDENGSPVWVTPVLADGASTTVDICVDFDGDQNGSLVDAYGFGYDLRLMLNRLESRKIFDPFDGDQTGMIVYVCDPPGAKTGAQLAAAWGQAPGFASAGEPGLDLGTTAPPGTTFASGKSAEVIGDVDGDGKADPGDTIRYEVVVRNASRVPLPDVLISDTVPVYTTYVLDSTLAGTGGGAFPVPDSSSGSRFPLDDGGINLGPMPVNGLFTVTFSVLVDDPFPLDVDRVRNIAVVTVGDDTQYPEVETPIVAEASLVIQKATNGVDADLPPGPFIDVGAPVTWTYIITNTGAFTITDLAVTDSVSGVIPVFVGGDNGDGLLGLREAWTYLATGVANSGQYGNLGTAVGTVQGADPVTATDPSHYFGLAAGINVDKTPSASVVDPGEEVTYSYLIDNAGNVALTEVDARDDRCAPVLPVLADDHNIGDINGDEFLDLDEQWSYACAVVVTADVTNTVVVTAQDPLSRPVSAIDTAFVDVREPRIQLTKAASARTVFSGTTVVYTFTVLNNGDTPLYQVDLTDDRCAPLTYEGSSGNADDVLDVGEQWRYGCSAVIRSDTTNIAEVTAEDARGFPVFDTATWTVEIPYVYLPIIRMPAIDCPPPEGCPLEGRVKGLAVHEGLNLLYVASRSEDRLLVVDPYSFKIVDRLETGAEPWAVVVDEGAGRIYVSNYGSGDVWVYDVVTHGILAKIAVGGNPAQMAILPDLHTVFVVVREDSRIAVLEGLTLVQDLGSGGSGPYGIAADSLNQRIFVSNRDSSHFATLRREGGAWTVKSNIVLEDGRSLFSIAYNSASNRLYSVYVAADGLWYVDIWKPSDTALWGREGTLSVEDGGALTSPDVGGSGLVVNPATGNVFNANTAANSASVIDGIKDRVRATILLGDDPFPIAVNRGTNTVYIGLRGPGRVVKVEDSY